MRIKYSEKGSHWSMAVIGYLVVCCGLCGSAYAATGDITITSPSPDPASGSSFTSVVSIDVGSGDIAGYVFHIEYTPSVVHVTDIRGASTAPFNTNPGTNLSVVGGDSGDVTFSSDIDPSNPPSGIVELARIDFDVVGTSGSSSPLTITVSSIADSMGQSIATNPIAGSVTVAGTQTFDLTASVVGGNGTVTPTSGTYDAGTVVNLTATPDAGYRVKQWTGTDDNTSTGNTNMVTMDADKNVTVEFEEIPPNTFDLTASVVGGNGTVTPTSGTYDAGTVVNLTATPDSGYRLKQWTGTDDDASTGNTNTVTMDADKDVTVEFEEIPPNTFDLTASVVGGNGMVMPTSGTYDAGTVVNLTATPNAGYRVKEWMGTDDDASTGNTNTITMDADKNVTVEFELATTGVAGYLLQDFDNLDTDGSGSLTLAEAQTGDTTVLEEDFNEIDSNNDGEVTLEELQELAGCVVAPGRVWASDGLKYDSVIVSWTPVPMASGYAVYRNEENDFESATMLDMVHWPLFMDETAEAPLPGIAGCRPAGYTQYHYWIVALADCGESQPSDPESGYRGQNGAVAGSFVTTSVLLFNYLPGVNLFKAEETKQLWQPQPGVDYDAAGLDDDMSESTVREAVPGTVPPLPASDASVYVIEPNTVFETPQRVWLPLPDGLAAEDAQLYYYHIRDGRPTWYLAENVVGWMQDDSYLEITVDGQTYLGFKVRNGAVVQLGHKAQDSSLIASVVPHAGDAFFLLAMLIGAAIIGRVRTIRKTATH